MRFKPKAPLSAKLTCGARGQKFDVIGFRGARARLAFALQALRVFLGVGNAVHDRTIAPRLPGARGELAPFANVLCRFHDFTS